MKDKDIREVVIVMTILLVGLIFYPLVTQQVESATSCQEWEDETAEVTNETHPVGDLPEIITVENDENIPDTERIEVVTSTGNKILLEEETHYNVENYTTGEYEITDLP